MSPGNSLFLEHGEITGEPPLVPKELPKSSLAQRLLLRAMIDGYSIDTNVVDKACKQAITYTMSPGEAKKLQFVELSLAEYQRLITNFRKEPKQACAIVRQNLINIARDEVIPEADRKERLQRYLEGYLELISTLDNNAFPPDSRTTVHSGVPSYIPDGLSDMGSDHTIDQRLRSREKIRVVKRESYKKALPDLLDAIWNLRNSKVDPASDEAKEYLAKHVLTVVKMKMPYDHKNYAVMPRTRSIGLHEFVDTGDAVSVCRHIAMESQIRLQALGIESRLLKCDLDGGGHVANLVRINHRWNLADPTNPEADPKNEKFGRAFIRPIQLSEVPNQSWQFDVYRRDANGALSTKKYSYMSRNNMYYRILDNTKGLDD